MTLKTWIFLSVLAIVALIATAHAELGPKSAGRDKICHFLVTETCR